MTRLSRVLAASSAVVATLFVTSTAFACAKNSHFTFGTGHWRAPANSGEIYAIDPNDCNYISEAVQYTDSFEAYLYDPVNGSYHAGGNVLVWQGGSFTRLFTGLGPYQGFYVQDTGHNSVSDAATIAQ